MQKQQCEVNVAGKEVDVKKCPQIKLAQWARWHWEQKVGIRPHFFRDHDCRLLIWWPTIGGYICIESALFCVVHSAQQSKAILRLKMLKVSTEPPAIEREQF